MFLTFFPLDVTVPGPTMSIVEVACITGALRAKRGERGILREAQDEGRRKSSVCLALLIKRLLCRLSLSSLLHAGECHKACRAARKDHHSCLFWASFCVVPSIFR